MILIQQVLTSHLFKDEPTRKFIIPLWEKVRFQSFYSCSLKQSHECFMFFFLEKIKKKKGEGGETAQIEFKVCVTKPQRL